MNTIDAPEVTEKYVGLLSALEEAKTDLPAVWRFTTGEYSELAAEIEALKEISESLTEETPSVATMFAEA